MARSFGGEGSGNYIQLVTAGGILTPTQLSFSCWVYMDSSLTASETVRGRAWTMGSLSLLKDNNWTTMRILAPWTGTGGVWSFPMSANAWHHVFCRYNPTSTSVKPEVWVDGASVTVTTVTTPAGSYNAANVGYFIGSNTAGTVNWPGRIAEVAIWNTVIDRYSSRGDWVTPLYTYKRSPLTIHPANLIAYASLYSGTDDEILGSAVAISGTSAVAHPYTGMHIQAKSITSTGFTLQVGAPADTGTMYAIVSTSITPPSAVQIKAGNDSSGSAAAWADDAAITGAGENIFTVSGLASGTEYYCYSLFNDGSNDSVVQSVYSVKTVNAGAAYSLSRVGKLFDASESSPYLQFAWCSPIDTTEIATWPWDITVFGSADHPTSSDAFRGIHAFGLIRGEDPALVASWESYDDAMARSAFDAWEVATGQTAPAGNPIYSDATISDAGAPWIGKIGATWFLQYHGFDADENGQPQKLAKATGGPLNFTRIANGNDGIVISSVSGDHTLDPVSLLDGTGHNGYFKWGTHPFPDFPYTYWGAGRIGEASQVLGIYGSNNGEDWTLVTSRGIPFGKPEWQTLHHSMGLYNPTDLVPTTFFDAGNGEYAALGVRGENVYAPPHKHIVEAYVAGDGRTVTRQESMILSPAAGNTWDSDHIRDFGAIMFDGQLICLYRGISRDQTEHMMLAVGTRGTPTDKGAALAIPPHDHYSFDARGETALPAWLEASENAGGLSWSANGLAFPTGATATSIRLTTPFDPATTSFAEVVVREDDGNAGTRTSTRYGFSSDGTIGGTVPTTSVHVQTLTGTKNVGVVYKRAGTTHISQTLDAAWQSPAGRRYQNGVRWDIANKKVIGVLGEQRYRIEDESAAQSHSAYADITGNMYAAIGSVGGTFVVEQIDIRIGNTSGNTLPEVTNAEATSTTEVEFTFGNALIGDGSGVTINDGGSPVAGTWTRPTLTTARFTRTSGTWSGALTYDISGTDLRSQDDLVALADVTGEAITAFGGEPEPEPEGLAFVGPAIGNRTLKQNRPAVISVASRFTGATSYSLTGTVPTGMAFSTVTGAISGTPTTIQTRTGLKVTATDGVDSVDSDTFQIEIVEAPAAGAEGIIRSPIRGVVRGG